MTAMVQSTILLKPKRIVGDCDDWLEQERNFRFELACDESLRYFENHYLYA